MALRISPETLARASSRHPWRTIVTWVVALLVAGGLTGALLADVLSNDISFTNSAAWMVASLLVITVFMWGGMKREIVPGRWQIAVEGLTGFIDNLVQVALEHS